MTIGGSRFSLVKKIGADYSRYSGEHPRIVRNLIVDALISIFMVLSVSAFVTHASANSRLETLRKSGVVTMTASELVKHVQNENLKVYWFGPIKGDVYTIIYTNPIEIILSYLPAGSRLHDSFAATVSLETRSDLSRNTSILGANATTHTVDFLRAHRRVEIHYPSLDASWNPRMSSNRLQLIK